VPIKSRVLFLEKLGELFKDNDIFGCAAEGGVYQGEFAKEINRVFSEAKLYLFDTFTGFDERDLDIERDNAYSAFDAGHLKNTGERLVIDKLPYPDMCVIRKGYFPETSQGIDEKFCFVSLDFDLYKPTLAGLEFFVPRMVRGGVVLIHDYFSDYYTGVKDAVKAFESCHKKLNKFPVGDGISIGIQF
jgi:hypothetical protein